MIKKETILSVFDKKLTLLQYLKEIKKALEDSIVESFSCDQIDATHVKFSIDFADGTKYETDVIEVPQGPQGEKGDTGATPNISVSVSAETLEPNESATASVEQGGTPAAPTIAIAFGIPKGEQGEAGTSAKMYLHKLDIIGIHINVYSSNMTPFTAATLYNWLYDNGFYNKDNSYPINCYEGQLQKISATQAYFCNGLYVNSNYFKNWFYYINVTPGTGFNTITKSDNNLVSNTYTGNLFKDVVIEL